MLEVTVLDSITTTTIIGHRIQISLSKAPITGTLVSAHREATALDLTTTTTTIGLRIQISPILIWILKEREVSVKDQTLSGKTILDKERITLAPIPGSVLVERFRHTIPVWQGDHIIIETVETFPMVQQQRWSSSLSSPLIWLFKLWRNPQSNLNDLNISLLSYRSLLPHHPRPIYYN